MIENNNGGLIYDVGFFLRYIFLGIFFLWAFYRAFVTEYLLRRISFALITFTTVAIGLFVYERPVNLIGIVFYGSLALMGSIDLIMETQKLRFYESFKRAKKKFIHITHPGRRKEDTI